MNSNVESTEQFEDRKREHIQLALRSENEAVGGSGFDSVKLWHEALPEINFSDVTLQTKILGAERRTPFLVSSMTAGHAGSVNLNLLLAQACSERGWLFGVGSQRRELNDSSVRDEWRAIRKNSPQVQLLGNLGLSQLILTTDDKVRELVDVLEAEAMIIHLNPLQECLQPEGTPNFAGGLERLTQLKKNLNVPVVVKETGCGFSPQTLLRLNETGVDAVDVSGFGGTHWGRIEGQRSAQASLLSSVADTFASWGVSTVDSLVAAQKLNAKFEVWASGGVRSGLDAAKSLALGASCVGYAKPILQAALVNAEELRKKMQTYEYELRTALFCTGSRSIQNFKDKKVIQWQKV